MFRSFLLEISGGNRVRIRKHSIFKGKYSAAALLETLVAGEAKWPM
jgi:hypothetical protein